MVYYRVFIIRNPSISLVICYLCADIQPKAGRFEAAKQHASPQPKFAASLSMYANLRV